VKAEYPLPRVFTLDAIVAEESLRSFTKDVSFLRLRLLEYVRILQDRPRVPANSGQERRQHLRSPKDTTLDLHNLAQMWHILLGNLSDFHDLLTFLLKSHEQALDYSELDTPDRMRFNCLMTKVTHLQRWTGIYRDRTNIRINLVSLATLLILSIVY
jgi:hypothetical protein